MSFPHLSFIVLAGCYYLLKHYQNGEQIETNEPCLNCSCVNSMLMCYLRVCPYVRPIGDKCIIEKVPGDCCPRITCPDGNNLLPSPRAQPLHKPCTSLTTLTTSRFLIPDCRLQSLQTRSQSRLPQPTHSLKRQEQVRLPLLTLLWIRSIDPMIIASMHQVVTWKGRTSGKALRCQRTPKNPVRSVTASETRLRA